jgi:hypothetical protein
MIEKRGTTMSDGLELRYVKCPFCKHVDGIEFGRFELVYFNLVSCPDGNMAISLVKSSCQGYPGNSYAINYTIEGGASRVAYLPNNAQGSRILARLKIAFDRRLVFSLGVSLSTGVPGPVWSIHHKTSLVGGAAVHGYPDTGYLDRVDAELKERGV